jgi:hypothetical protein
MQRALAFLAVCLLAAPASASLITRDITGMIFASSGSGADVGAGSISGFVTYDETMPSLFSPGFNGGTLYDALFYSLEFSNGPTITDLDTGAEFEIDDATGDLLSIFVDPFNGGFFGPVTGFGFASTDLELQTTGFDRSVAFTEFGGFSFLVEGSVAFVDDNGQGEVPVAPTVVLMALGGLLALRRRQRRADR